MRHEVDLELRRSGANPEDLNFFENAKEILNILDDSKVDEIQPSKVHEVIDKLEMLESQQPESRTQKLRSKLII